MNKHTEYFEVKNKQKNSSWFDMTQKHNKF